MVDQDNQPPEDSMMENAQAQKAEALVFATIVRYLAERLTDVEPDVDAGDLTATGDLYLEIAEAFENTNGFEFSSDQALALSHAFAMLEGGMKILAEQAHESGHTNAAAKMEWAALKARNMTAKLETHHLASSGGIIAFSVDDDDEDVSN
jgi:hypothetical protein